MSNEYVKLLDVSYDLSNAVSALQRATSRRALVPYQVETALHEARTAQDLVESRLADIREEQRREVFR